MAARKSYVDRFYTSNDGLRLHYRDYAGPSDRPPVLCIPGLTRNARDFEPVAERIAGAWRVIAVSLRGRGESAYARDPFTYVPLFYIQDLEALMNQEKLERVIVIGTSLGGILAMMLGVAGQHRLIGALLNDVGPVIDPGGLARIRGYVGRAFVWPTWVHAARDLAELQDGQLPERSLEEWLVLAKRWCRLTAEGRIVLDYDPRIAEPFRAPEGQGSADLWPAFRTLAACPLVSLRGELSDILSAETQQQMAEVAGARPVVVPGVGHAPTFDEPEALAAVDLLLGDVLARR